MGRNVALSNLSKVSSIVLGVILACSLVPLAPMRADANVSGFSEGEIIGDFIAPITQVDEVPEGAIGVYTADDLNAIRNDMYGYYVLMDDIDLTDWDDWEPIGTNENPFCGRLDGNGHKITGMNIAIDGVTGKVPVWTYANNYVDGAAAGLFGVIDEEGEEEDYRNIHLYEDSLSDTVRLNYPDATYESRTVRVFDLKLEGSININDSFSLMTTKAKGILFTLGPSSRQQTTIMCVEEF